MELHQCCFPHSAPSQPWLHKRGLSVLTTHRQPLSKRTWMYVFHLIIVYVDFLSLWLSDIKQVIICLTFSIYKMVIMGFPGGAVVENLPANVRDTGSSPGLGRAHMPRSNWAREPRLLSLCVCSLCSATREAAIVRGPRTAMKSGPRLPQLEKALAQKRRPNTVKNK